MAAPGHNVSALSSLFSSWVDRVLPCLSLSMPSLSSLFGLSAGLVGLVAGQYFPPPPKDVRVIHSKHQEGVKISYKEVCLRPTSVAEMIV